MSAFDDEELIQLSFLRDEETDALITEGFLSDQVRLSSPLEDAVDFSHDELVLTVTAGACYPVHPVAFEIENVSLPREDVDGLRRSLRAIVTAAEETNNMEKWLRRNDSNAFGVFEPTMVVLELARRTATVLKEYRARRPRGSQGKDGSDSHLWFLGSAVKRPVDVRDLAYSTKELAYRLLQVTPADITARIPLDFRVLHIEQVLRADLAHNLQTFQETLRDTLLHCSRDELRQHVPFELRNRRSEDLVDYLVQPRLTFHGTQRQNVPSIVRHGFAMPGKVNLTTGEVQEVRCGSTYGRGIYTSPNAEFSLSYTGHDAMPTSTRDFFGLKLIVCATIMGRVRRVSRDDECYQEDKPLRGADSHVANDGLEWVVFDTAQVIPVYVIHLDWGADNYAFFQGLPQDPASWTSRLSTTRRLNKQRIEREALLPGDRQRMKEAVYARAAKYFPYGYGPATGNKFVVEEVGEVSEDEEDYGDYQALRAAEAIDNGIDKNFWSWVKESDKETLETLGEGQHKADEYLRERKALRVPKAFGHAATKWDALDVSDDGDDDIPELAILQLHDGT